MVNSESVFPIINYKRGDVIYNVDEKAVCFYWIMKGNVDIKSGLAESDSLIDSAAQGQFVGALSYFSGKSREGKAIAASEVMAIRIDEAHLAEFIKLEPESVIELMKSFSYAISQANEAFLQAKAASSGRRFAQNKIFQVVEGLYDPVVYTERKYALLLPKAHEQFLLTKDVVCPICDKSFKTNQIRSSKLELDKTGNDFRRQYKLFDEIWYQIWCCPVCGYAQFYNDFFKVPVKITAQLEAQLMGCRTLNNSSKIKTSINEVLEEHYHLNRIFDLIKPNPYQKARLWQSLTWIYEDVGDLEAAKIAKGLLKRYLEEGYFNSNVPLSEDDEVKLLIKLALISDEFGEYKEALNLLLKTSQMKQVNKIYRQKVQDMILEIKGR